VLGVKPVEVFVLCMSLIYSHGEMYSPGLDVWNLNSSWKPEKECTTKKSLLVKFTTDCYNSVAYNNRSLFLSPVKCKLSSFDYWVAFLLDFCQLQHATSRSLCFPASRHRNHVWVFRNKTGTDAQPCAHMS
jgi:hypothetical protein